MPSMEGCPAREARTVENRAVHTPRLKRRRPRKRLLDPRGIHKIGLRDRLALRASLAMLGIASAAWPLRRVG